MDLIDERNRRQNEQFAATAPRSFFDTPSNDNQDDGGDDNGGGFFGHLFHPVAQAVHDVGAVTSGVGHFFGGMAKDLADTTIEAGKTVRDLVESPIKEHQAGQKNDAALKLIQDFNKQTAAWTPEDYNDPKNKQMIAEHQKQVHTLLDQARDINASDTIKDRDAKKSAAATAETFVNLATLGGAGAVENLAKGGVKEIAADVAENGLKSGLKTGAKVITKGSADAVAERTAAHAADVGGKAALKTVARNTTEGALFGSAYGGLDAARKGESNHDILHNALMGGVLGAPLGAAGSVFNKNVRGEAAQLPGKANEALQTAGNALRDKNLQLGEGGYIRNPFAPGDAPEWAPEQMFDNLAPEDQAREQLIQQAAAEAKSPEQFARDAAEFPLDYDKNAKGGQLVQDDSGYGSPTYKRISDHSKFYRDFYAENGRKPSQAATRDAVLNTLEKRPGGHDLISPDEADIYQILKDRQDAQDALLRDPEAAARAGVFDNGPAVPPQDTATQLQDSLTGRSSSTPRNSRMPAGLPKGPQGTAPLDGLAPEEGTLQPKYDNPEDLQAALARGESETNPLLDYIDPRARTAAPDAVQGELPVGAPANPYEGATQDLSTPALPQGDLPTPPTPAQAKRTVAGGGEAPAETLNKLRDGTKPMPLPANTEDVRDIAIKQTEAGKNVPVATNNAHPTKGYVDAVRAIGEDNTSGSFIATRTPEMNLEEALKKRGGTDSPLFKELNQNNTDLREATARQSDYMAGQKKEANTFVKEYKWTEKKDIAARQYIEAETPEAKETVLVEFKKEFGDKAAEGLQKLDAQWKAERPIIREDANKVITHYAGDDRAIGDLGENFLPRVYKRGKTFKDSILDVAHGGLDKIGGRNGLMNLEETNGYLSKESDSTQSGLRSVNQAPLNSDVAKPNTRFLSTAQHRTAEDPQGPLEGALTSIMRYKDAVSRAQELTPVIAKGRSQQKVIELVNGETGNLRQMYDSLNDQLNAVSGKTSSFDTKLVNTERGNQVVRIASKLQSRISRSTIVGSANSAFAQTGQLPLMLAESGPKNFAQGMSDVIRYIGKKASPIEDSALMRTRYPDIEQDFTVNSLHKVGQKATSVLNKPFHLIEKTSSELAWYSSYARAQAEGVTGKEAVQLADRYTAKIIGERSPGARAALYESKALSPVTAYTLEVNQMYQVAKQYFKRDPKKAAMLVGALWLYNQGYKAVTGNKLNADPIQAAWDAKNILTSNGYTDSDGNPLGIGERVARAAGRIGGEFLDATPLGTQVAGQLYPTNGIRVPFGGGDRMLTRADVFGDTNLGRYGASAPIASGFSNPLLLLGVPGMGQIQRSVEGAEAYNQGGPQDKNGDSKFDIAQNQENQFRAWILGMYGTPEGQAYLRQRSDSLAGRNAQ